MSTVKERLKEIMEIRQMRQVDVINRCNYIIDSTPDYERMSHMRKAQMCDWLAGRYEPNQWNILILSKALNVSEGWLMGLDVSMVRKDKADQAEEDVALLERFSRLTSENKRLAFVLIDALLTDQNRPK